VVIPFGNDGVGIPGPIIDAAPDRISILVATDVGADVLGAAEFYPRVIVPDLTVDMTSEALVPALDVRFAASPCWQRMPAASGVETFDHRCAGTRQSGG